MVFNDIKPPSSSLKQTGERSKSDFNRLGKDFSSQDIKYAERAIFEALNYFEAMLNVVHHLKELKHKFQTAQFAFLAVKK